MVDVGIGSVWDDAWDVYKLLFRRSVPLAALVYAFVEGVYRLAFNLDNHGARVAVALAAAVLFVAGPVLVQGALVEIVRNVHDAKRPESMASLLRLALRRVPSLFWASFVYGIGVLFGLLLLVFPGLLVASRWSLMAPLIMLEGESAGDARQRSRELVKPYTWPVLGVLALTFVVTTVITGLLGRISDPAIVSWAISVAAAAVTVPFTAHVLTVIYYRITDPEHPVIHTTVGTWRSVWAGA